MPQGCMLFDYLPCIKEACSINLWADMTVLSCVTLRLRCQISCLDAAFSYTDCVVAAVDVNC